jgi:beta-galactosidase
VDEHKNHRARAGWRFDFRLKQPMTHFMKKTGALIFATVLLSAISIHAAGDDSSTGARTTTSFDANWLFLKADAAGAEQNNFDDSAWRKLDVPHDWSIEGPFSETNKTSGSDAFLPAGVGWYRKHFSLPTDFPNACYFIEFDGVMANSDVWINGFHLGHRPNGYVGFSYELTGHLNFGGDNVIAVRCDNSVQPASRFYCGAGIYRHVRLVRTTPLHFLQNGIFISTPQVNETQATIHAQVIVTNEHIVPQKIFLNLSVLDPAGKIVATAQTPVQIISNLDSLQFNQDVIVKNPQIWDLEQPALYQARVEVCGPPLETDSATSAEKFMPANAGSMSDDDVVSFGIREFHFDADTGFWLNGKNFKVKGVCLHADGGAFGMAVPISIWEARLKNLKSLGVNAIRTAHNPPAPEFLNLCDRMGFLVMDEMFDCWTVGKIGLDGQHLADYHLYFNDWSKIDTADIVRRDRNHPSIILYSAGNEIHDTPNAELAKKILSGLVEIFHTNDPTRPVTQALLRPNVSHDYDDGLADMLDVVGQNYRVDEILAAHAQKPSRKIIGTENGVDRKQWLALRDNAPYAGQFLWSGIDYMGEARRWPLVCHGSGLLDRTGAPRPVAFERQSWWGDAPMVFIARRIAATDAMPVDPGYAGDEKFSLVLFPDWTPKNLSPHDENVEIYSNCKEVELFLNGKSLGAKEINADASPRNWRVPFEPGTLKAVATDENGKVVATDELRTAGEPAQIILSADKNKIADDWDDVSSVTATVADKDGVTVPGADNLISFKISGAGFIAAVDNADNMSHEPLQADERSAFHGRCVAYVKANAASGEISLTASATGLKSAAITIAADGAK